LHHFKPKLHEEDSCISSTSHTHTRCYTNHHQISNDHTLHNNTGMEGKWILKSMHSNPITSNTLWKAKHSANNLTPSHKSTPSFPTHHKGSHVSYTPYLHTHTPCMYAQWIGWLGLALPSTTKFYWDPHFAPYCASWELNFGGAQTHCHTWKNYKKVSIWFSCPHSQYMP
jgi:hypothetical protein